MAMTAFEIFGMLKLDSSEFDRGLQNAVSRGTVMGNAITGAFKMGAQAIVSAGRAAVNFGQDSINAATSFESAFTGVRKTVDATEEEYAELSGWISEASTRMASSAEDIAATMEIAGQLGISGVEGLEKFTETMIMLGDTTNLSSEEAASALAKFGNIAGVEAVDMSKIGSVIVDLGNNFATTEADIVAMSTRLASAGTIAGFSATDILALSTAMSSVGINAEAGGTAMSTIITKIGRSVDAGLDSDKLKLYAQTAGMSAEEFSNAWKGSPTEALQSFVKGLDSVIENGGNVTEILDDLGIKGIRETNTIKSLALASDVLSGAVDRANIAFEEDVALQNEAVLRYSTTESQALQTAEAFKNLKRAIGEELIPMYGNLMSFSSKAMQSMQKGFEEGGFDGLMKSLGESVAEGLNAINEHLPDVLAAGGSLLGALGQGIMDNLPAIVDSAVQIVNMLLDGIVENLPIIVEGALQIILGLATGIGEHLPELVPTIVSVVMKIVEVLIDNIDLLASAALQIIIGLAVGLINSLPKLIEKVPEIIHALVNAFFELAPMLAIAAANLIDQLVVGLIQSIPALYNGLNEIWNEINTFFGELIVHAVEWGADIIDGLINGIKSMLGNLGEAVSGVADKIKNLIGFSEPEEGPLSDFHTYAPDMMELFAQGIRDNANLLTDAVSDVFDIGGNIEKATSGSVSVAGSQSAGDIVIPVYIGQDRIDEILIKANQINNYVTGGRA